jgi:hypothetical protein
MTTIGQKADNRTAHYQRVRGDLVLTHFWMALRNGSLAWKMHSEGRYVDQIRASREVIRMFGRMFGRCWQSRS